jgi:hypothetical protein
MYIKINNATRLKNYTVPKNIVFEDCRLYVYSTSWCVKYHLLEDGILLIQIDTPHEETEFENIFGLGSHCEGFVPGMIVAFKPNNETGIILNNDINLIFK